MPPRSVLVAAAVTACFVIRLSSAVKAAEDISLIDVPAAPEHGFQHGYLLFLPKRVDSGPPQYLLVEPNNTGHPDNNIKVHHAEAVKLARGRLDYSVGNFVAVRLGIPLLVPVFPRPSSIYTQSLDRDTILIDEGRLSCESKKILLNGCSASGMFANRFTFLHPDIVAAVAFGGVSGFIMIPISDISGYPLKFPLGLADFDAVARHPFHRAAYSHVAQFAYMGEKDTNDAVLHEDAYPADERALIFKLFGRTMMPKRWNTVKAVYRQQKPADRLQKIPWNWSLYRRRRKDQF